MRIVNRWVAALVALYDDNVERNSADVKAE